MCKLYWYVSNSARFLILSTYLTHGTSTCSILKPKVLVADKHWQLRSALKTESENKQWDLTSSYVWHEKTHFIPESHTLYIQTRNVRTWSYVKCTTDQQIVVNNDWALRIQISEFASWLQCYHKKKNKTFVSKHVTTGFPDNRFELCNNHINCYEYTVSNDKIIIK